MQHIQGQTREQLTLLPEALDDYIAQANPVLILDAFVDALDIERLGFQHAILKETGRPPYHPADLLKLYLYGYLHRIRSSRRLDLFGSDLVAIDGSKFKAVNSPARDFTERKLKKQIKSLDKMIEEYLDEPDQTDDDDPGRPPAPTAEELQQKIQAMKRRRAKLRQIEKEMNETGESQISVTDPDARSVPVSAGRRTAVAYNVQVSVDATPSLFLYCGPGTDNGVERMGISIILSSTQSPADLGSRTLHRLRRERQHRTVSQAFRPTWAVTMARKLGTASRQASPPTFPNPTHPPIPSSASSPRRTSATIQSKMATGARPIRCSPFVFSGKRRAACAAITPPAPAPPAPSKPAASLQEGPPHLALGI